MLRLRFRTVDSLASALGTPPKKLQEVAGSTEKYVKRKTILGKRPGKRDREVICVAGPLRQLQFNLHTRILRPRHRPSVHSHGGIKGRNIKTNAEPHLSSVFVYCADIANFYPSIHYSRVYDLFANQFECAPDVARILTRLCTFDHHLAIGLITSPILADCMLDKVDRRVEGMCHKHNLVYTRFVDDLTISGIYDIKSGATQRIVGEILQCHGFSLSESKNEVRRFSDEGTGMTGLRNKGGRLDVQKQYVENLQGLLSDCERLAQGEIPVGEYATKDQIGGKISFVRWINRGHLAVLWRRFRAIDWRAVDREAERLGLVSNPSMA
ncbi:reverse transcriptase family protein [Singulisphaera sp. PoT]|uniref:reverse transcriptase family protein n=1 Tax=Singulisphaera sp. PoT TaxID=3411797 RepID=UPI003BF5F2C7